MRFNKDAESRIADLEKTVDNLNRRLSARSYGNQGATPIGFRMPWVSFKLDWTYTSSTYGYEMFWLPENIGVTGETYWGSETDCCIHASEDDGFHPWPKFEIVGRGTWLSIFTVEFPIQLYGSTTKVMENNYRCQFGFLDTTPDIIYMPGTQTQYASLSFPTVWTVGSSPAHTLQFHTVFTASGNITPANPRFFQLYFLHYFFAREEGSSSILYADYQRELFTAGITFIRMDPEPKRKTRFLMPGDGEVEVTPDPEPEPDPPGEITPPGGPTPP